MAEKRTKTQKQKAEQNRVNARTYSLSALSSEKKTVTASYKPKKQPAQQSILSFSEEYVLQDLRKTIIVTLLVVSILAGFVVATLR